MLRHSVLVQNVKWFAKFGEKLDDTDDLLVAELLHKIFLLRIWEEEDFKGGGQASDLNFAIKAALVAADAIHDSRNVVELMLDLLK